MNPDVFDGTCVTINEGEKKEAKRDSHLLEIPCRAVVSTRGVDVNHFEFEVGRSGGSNCRA